MNPKDTIQQIRDFKPAEFLQQPLFADRISVSAVIFALLLNGLNIVVLFTRLHKADFPVPIHYSSIVGFDQVGPWFYNYQIGFYALVVTIVNTLLSVKSFRRNRVASFFLLLGSIVVGLFCLVISFAFSVIV